MNGHGSLSAERSSEACDAPPPRKYPFLTSSTVMRFFFTLLGILGDTLAIIVIIAIIVRLFPSPVRSSHWSVPLFAHRSTGEPVPCSDELPCSGQSVQTCHRMPDDISSLLVGQSVVGQDLGPGSSRSLCCTGEEKK